MRTILAAVDLGAGAQHVLEGAVKVARWGDAALHVVHVVESVSPEATTSPAAQTVLENEREELGVLVQRCCDGRRIESQQVLAGKPAEAILARGRELKADLIVLGAHTEGELGARLFGTTAERVVRAATVPCLIMRAALPHSLTSVTVATDFSAESIAAAQVAATWLRTFGEPAARPQLHLLHVGWPIERVDDPEIESRTLRPKLLDIEQLLATPGVAPIASHVVWSNRPAAAIAGWARKLGCDLLVLGTTGRSGLRDRLLGSVASSLARQAPCAVLLVPAAAAHERSDTGEPQLNCVVAAVDFSPASLAAADWVSAAFAPGARHVLVHVTEPPDAADLATGGQELRARLVEHARAEASARLTRLFPGTPQAGLQTASGRPADELLRSARAWIADLICIGGHTHPHGMWGMLGTTAEHLIHISHVPVLIVRGRPEAAPKRILAPIDNSRESRQALRWAGALARRFGAELQVVHVLSSRYIGAAKMVSGMAAAKELECSYAAQAQTWLRDQIVAAGLDPATCSATVVSGAPTYEVLAMQQRWAADLLVLGNRGYGAIRGALIGSVASGVVRGAPCPVLVVPAHQE